MTLLNVLKNKQPADANPEEEPARRVRYWRPRYKVEETEGAYLAQVDLPGVEKDAVDVSLAEGVLEISASRGWKDASKWRALSGESEGDLAYRLRLAIGDEVNPEAIAANLDDGVLRVTLPKAEEKKPRRIALS